MVNTKEMTESLIKELAFSEEELRELKAAKEKPIVFDERLSGNDSRTGAKISTGKSAEGSRQKKSIKICDLRKTRKS